MNVKTLLLGVGLLLAGFGSSTASAQAVRVDVTNGHGSGVYIGNGNFLTAAHVTEKETVVNLFFETGSVKAEVKWTNFKYDYSLVHTDEVVPFPAIDIRCEKPSVGEVVFSAGYPMNIGRIMTTGWVGGGEQKIGDWDKANVVVMPGAPGVSGSGIVNTEGQLIGLFVGGYQGTGYGVMNPVYPVCDILPKVSND